MDAIINNSDLFILTKVGLIALAVVLHAVYVRRVVRRRWVIERRLRP